MDKSKETRNISPSGSHNESFLSDSQNVRQRREKEISSDNRKVSRQKEKGKTRRKRERCWYPP